MVMQNLGGGGTRCITVYVKMLNLSLRCIRLSSETSLAARSEKGGLYSQVTLSGELPYVDNLPGPKGFCQLQRNRMYMQVQEKKAGGERTSLEARFDVDFQKFKPFVVQQFSLNCVLWILNPFCKDILTSPLLQDQAVELNALVDQYDNVLRSLLDLHAPLKRRTVTLRPRTPWDKPEVGVQKNIRRRLERK